MARKKITRRLKPLPNRPSLKASDHKTQRLLEILRGIAIHSQREESRPFYPVRDIAEHFRVSTSVVAKGYEQLEDEGLLSMVRGSRTILQGATAVRRLNVLSFIGMPAAVSSFVALQDYRTFFVRLRRELRARGFAVAMVLFDSSDIGSAPLYNRLAKHRFDTVLWYRPDASARDIVSRLTDKGIRVIALNDYRLSPIPNRYEVQREIAISEVLRYWRAQARIDSVVVVRGVKAAAMEETLERLLEEQQLAFEFRNADNKSAAKFLESLGRGKARAIIFPSWAASQFSFREPDALMQLADHCHVAFTGGPPSIQFAQVRDVRVELVVVDWQLVAEKIVNDLISKKAFEGNQTTVFAAQTQIRALLSQYSQSI